MNATKKTNRKKLYLLSYLTIIMISGTNVGIEASTFDERYDGMFPSNEQEAFDNVTKIQFAKIKFAAKKQKDSTGEYTEVGAKALKKALCSIECNRDRFPGMNYVKTEAKENNIEFVQLYELMKYCWGFYEIIDKKSDKNKVKKHNQDNKTGIYKESFQTLDEAIDQVKANNDTSKNDTSKKGGDKDADFSKLYTTLDEAIRIHLYYNEGFLKQCKKSRKLLDAIKVLMPAYFAVVELGIEKMEADGNTEEPDENIEQVDENNIIVTIREQSRQIDLNKLSQQERKRGNKRSKKSRKVKKDENDEVLSRIEPSGEMETRSKQESGSSAPYLITAAAIVGVGVAAMSRKSKNSAQNENKNKQKT